MFLKSLKRCRIISALCLLYLMLICSQSISASTIGGFVYDKQRNPLYQVDIELLDDLYRQIARAQTDSTGRYEFNGLSDGNYTIRALPHRYDLIDQSLPVEINTVTTRGSGTGNAYIPLDFYLLPKKGGLADAELSVIFSQDVPPEAKKLYQAALSDFSDKKKEQGVAKLFDSLKIFPDYYLALYQMGKELYILGKYQDAYQYFLKASQVNPKSATSFYYLGSSLYKLGKEYNKAALASLNQAFFLAPASTQVLYMLGKVERTEGNYLNAEKHLLQAKKLSKISIPEIHKELAQLYANDLKKYKEAADELELYLKSSKLSKDDENKTKKVIADLRSKSKQ